VQEILDCEGLFTKHITACLILSAQLASAAAMEKELRVTVRLRNSADVPKATLMAGEREATWVYQKAGIATEWLDCTATSGQADLLPVCESAMGPAEVSIEILPLEKGHHVDHCRETLGASVVPADPAEEDLLPTEAYVCYPCVSGLALSVGRQNEVVELVPAILGSVLAHELGHLLGVRDHAALGIMHTPWTGEELTLAEQGRLLFTCAEKRIIQAHMRMRQAAACASHSPYKLLTSRLGQAAALSR